MDPQNNSMIERPNPLPRAPDLRLLWAVSAVVWVVSLIIYVNLDLANPSTFWPSVANEVASATAGAAFSVLVAAFVFDRLRRAAERRASEQHRIEEQELQELTHMLWVEEYSLPYEGLINLMAEYVTQLHTELYRLCHINPMRRALETREYAGHLIATKVAQVKTRVSSLPFASTATPSGVPLL